MGLNNTCHVEGGFAAWRKAEYRIDGVDKQNDSAFIYLLNDCRDIFMV